MPVNRSKTERPREALLQLGIGFWLFMCSVGGSLGADETPLLNIRKSHPAIGGEQCLVGSLTGAVASQRVTEAFKGWLSSYGKRASTCKGISQLNCKTYKSRRRESGT